MSRASPTRKDGYLFKTNFVCFSTCRRFPRFPQNKFCGVLFCCKKNVRLRETIKKALCGSKVPKRWYSRRESNPQRPLRRGLLYPFNYGSVLRRYSAEQYYISPSGRGLFMLGISVANVIIHLKFDLSKRF